MKFDVVVTRAYYASSSVTIEAETLEEAQKLADKIETDDLDFNIDSYDDTVEICKHYE